MVQSVLRLLLQAALRSIPTHLVETGAWEFARRILARIAGSTVSAAFAVKLTEPGTTHLVSPPSGPNTELEPAQIRENVLSILECGPHSFTSSNSQKRKADHLLDIPRYRCRFAWSDCSPENHLSPAALYTGAAPPLASPPTHILGDPVINTTLQSLGDAIKVETPFNVDRLENLLVDHPSQPFVQSVMKGLREGFWPFDEGEWDLELSEVIGNYASEPPDLDTIHAFRDKECARGHWSDPLPTTDLLPGMKISPMFVVWQNQKPHVVIDHSASGLNDGVPRSEAKVKYDDMRPFGQTLRDAHAANPHRPLFYSNQMCLQHSSTFQPTQSGNSAK